MNDDTSRVVTQYSRLQSLDVLRGIALCGILVMNITSFALPATAYSNPTVFNDGLISNHLIFAFTHIFFDQKMMGLFSLLFGASAMLFMEKQQHKGSSIWFFYYSRIFWLTIFGILHGLFLWQGDILFFYGLCGLLLFFFQFIPKILLLLIGLAVFLSAIAVGEYGQHWLNSMSYYQVEHFNWAWHSSEREIIEEIRLRMGSYSDLVQYRIDTSELNLKYSMSTITRIFIGQGLLRAFGLMLVGMAMYRLGAFKASPPKYLAFILLVIGTGFASFGLWQQYQHHWAIGYSMFRGRSYNHFATPFIVIAYMLIVVNLCQKPIVPMIKRSFANYGRMAFSNYLFQSLICTSLFYGYGLGWFAKFDRLQLMLITLIILSVQIVLSNLWLRHFHYGPLEWVWRCLTFFKLPAAPR